MGLLNSKKGQLANYIIVVIVLFIFGFFSLLGFVLTSNIIEGFAQAGYDSGVFKETADNFLNAVKIMDYVIILIMASLIIGIGITSYRLNTAPMFFIVTLIMGLFVGVVSYFFNYMFIQIASEQAFTNALVYFPKTILICTNLHWVSLISMIVGSIALYGKKETTAEIIG